MALRFIEKIIKIKIECFLKKNPINKKNYFTYLK